MQLRTATLVRGVEFPVSKQDTAARAKNLRRFFGPVKHRRNSSNTLCQKQGTGLGSFLKLASQTDAALERDVREEETLLLLSSQRLGLLGNLKS